MSPFDEDKRYGWHLELGRAEYDWTLNLQRKLVELRAQGFARDTIITVEHPPVITVGRDGHAENFQSTDLVPVPIERGGDVTYHGPGQLVAYFIFNLARRGKDLHHFTHCVQQGIIDTIAQYDVTAGKGDKYTGVWVGQLKIASVGIAVKRWISFHGAAINISTDLKEFERIRPCGLDPQTMISLGKFVDKSPTLSHFGRRLMVNYSRLFEMDFSPIDLEILAEDAKSQSGGESV